jgi:putative redox protein
MKDRIVHTRWTGGMRAVTVVDGFEIVVDEPEIYGGTDTGPQPTDLLLASIGSCIALSMAFVARKRGIELLGLDVRVVGSYDGLKFDRISVRISSGTSRDVLESLMPEAERVCYVSNTLRHRPELVVDVG